jgi:hypothetical protein
MTNGRALLSQNLHTVAASSSYPRPILGQVAAAGMTTEDGASVQLIPTAPGQMRVVIAGALATPGASALQAVMLKALVGKPRRIHLDLTGLTDCSPVGVAALATCLALAGQLEDGVGVSVAGAAGRRALLRSLADR